MIVLSIAFRGKNTTNDWKKCTQRLKRTLDSISNQTSKDFKCIVACNEIPNYVDKYDNHFEFIKTIILTPTEWIEKVRDKFYKLTVITERIKEILKEQEDPTKGIYVMPVADDYLNINIVQYCSEHTNEHGIVSAYRYYMNENNRFLHKYTDLHTFCGSCNIIKMFLEDLLDKNTANPKKCHVQVTVALLNSRYPIRFNHHTLVERYSKMEKKFAVLPFPSTIYVCGTGDNISSINKSNMNNKRFHLIAFLRKLNILQYKIFNKKVKKQFGVQ